MNRLNDSDLREALRRREAQRPTTEVPDDFCADVMRAVEQQRPRHAWHTALTALAVAAGMALLVMLTWPETEVPSAVPVKQVPHTKLLLTDYSPDSTLGVREASLKLSSRRPTAKKAKAPTTAAEGKSSTGIDSLDYYIAKLERGLEQVRESCYEAHMERLIRADVQLQKIVNTLMIKELMADSVSTASRLTTEYIEL